MPQYINPPSLGILTSIGDTEVFLEDGFRRSLEITLSSSVTFSIQAGSSSPEILPPGIPSRLGIGEHELLLLNYIGIRPLPIKKLTLGVPSIEPGGVAILPPSLKKTRLGIFLVGPGGLQAIEAAGRPSGISPGSPGFDFTIRPPSRDPVSLSWGMSVVRGRPLIFPVPFKVSLKSGISALHRTIYLVETRAPRTDSGVSVSVSDLTVEIYLPGELSRLGTPAVVRGGIALEITETPKLTRLGSPDLTSGHITIPVDGVRRTTIGVPNVVRETIYLTPVGTLITALGAPTFLLGPVPITPPPVRKTKIESPDLLRGEVFIYPPARESRAASGVPEDILRGEMTIEAPSFERIVSIGEPFIVTTEDAPLTIMLPSGDRNQGGLLTNRQLGLGFRFLTELPVTQEQAFRQQLIESMVFSDGLLGFDPPFIPAQDALSGKTYYRAFYVYNASTFSTKTNIKLWINGGEPFTIRLPDFSQDKIIYEHEEFLRGNYPIPYLSDWTNNLTREQFEDFLYNSTQRSSTLNQLKISTLVSPVKNMREVDEEGRNIGFDLNNYTFTPSYQKISLPDLAPQEYVGVYLKIETNFSDTLNIPQDLAFVHLSWVSGLEGRREVFPGQIKNSFIFLPSIVLGFSTRHKKILDYISQETELLYSNYPPYFTHYEDTEGDQRKQSHLYSFSRTAAAGVALARTQVKQILPGLYVKNFFSGPSPELIYDGEDEPQAYREALDLLGYMFNLTRRPNEPDAQFRDRIILSIRQNSTINGLRESLEYLFRVLGYSVRVKIYESHKTFFEAEKTNLDTPIRAPGGSLLYGLTIMVEPLPETLFTIKTPLPTGSPVTLNLTNPFNRLEAPNYWRLVEALSAPSLRYIIQTVAAAGIKIYRVIVREPGSGNSKGEIYSDRDISFPSS